MEANGTSKRTADSDQTVDTYAFCQNCMRVSSSLTNCDKCGTQLTSENHIGCYGAEPKRARTETNSTDQASNQPTNNATTNGSTVNGSRSTPTMNGTAPSSPATSTVNNSNPVPVPQALYVNRNIISTASEQTVATPQAIYMNVNNPVTSSNRSTPSTTSLSSSSVNAVANSASSGNSAVTNTSSSLPTLRSSLASADTRPNMSANNALMNSIGTTTRSATQNASSAAPNFPSNPHVAAGTTAQRPGYPPNTVAPSSNQAPNPNSVTVLQNMVSIPAQQIRIGAQKFKPLTSVQFKDDGILFTLKDYTYAPVLLNARAILKCKANLNLFQYPLFLLYLEGSCMKQIRNIFGLKEDEFSAENSCEMKRCITILPAITKDSVRDIITKGQNVEQDLRNMFGMMEMRYERYNKILEEISPEDGCDILLSLLGSRNVAPTMRVSSAATPSSSATVSRSRPAAPNVGLNLNYASGLNANSVAAAAAQRRMVAPSARQVPPIATGHAEGGPVMQTPMAANIAGRTPTLVIPSDAARWREMQRSLVVGGVYHVQTSGAQATQYCLWNGTQLVPCRVQNAEVQMDCHMVWFGSLRVRMPTKVRIKADQNAGFHFNLMYKNRQNALFLPNYAIPLCQVCRDSSLAAIFLDISPQFASSLRQKMGFYAENDPTLNPQSKEERRKRVILFMKTINNDQWDALVTMQNSGRYQQQEIDIMKALKILADCKNNNRVQQKITDWLTKKQPKPNLVVLENLAKEMATPEDAPAPSSDDDDDVIMTQEEVGIKCPYTQQVMKDPIRNKICGHNYEKAAIHEFIVRKRGTAKCPYAGCGNQTPLNLADMENNVQLQDYIRKNVTAK